MKPEQITKEGFESQLKVRVTEEMLDSFIIWSGDSAPLHTDEVFARSHGYAGRIVHGAALFSLVSRFFGMYFPGPNSVLLKSDISFCKPCYAPSDLLIKGIVKHYSEATQTLVINFEVMDSNDETIAFLKGYHKLLVI